MALLAEHPRAAFVYGKTRLRYLIDETRLRRHPDGTELHHPCFGSILARRSAFARVAIDETFETSEDVDWLARTREAGLVGVRSDQVVLEYRIHGGNVTSHLLGETQALLFRALKRSLDRRRRGTGS
jgi:hypothetical protein